jgi:D-threo-aldose 1-dehydrogenase
MEQIALGDTGRTTTRLGFGCSSLMGAMGRRASLAILEAAYDAGVRHFDVAPIYGYGEAESCLGDFLQRHRDITVTTKYGIPPAKKSPLLSLARRVGGPIVKAVPSAKHRLVQAASAVTRPSEKATFTPQQAKGSLERSLAALRTDHIDLWLLHEATAADLRDEALLNLLEEQVQQGTIGSFGIGSSADKIHTLLAQHPAYCRTLQYEWSVLDPDAESEAEVSPRSPFRIHHRALSENFRSLHRALSEDKQLCQRWSASTTTDLSNPKHLAHLMLKAALVMNPGSVILFSSKNPLHIQANAKTAEDPTLEAPARELHRLLQTERNRR